MKHEQLLEENCAIARTSAVVGERWVWMILRQAFNGARRFEEYQRGIGLDRNILVDKMTMLIEQGHPCGQDDHADRARNSRAANDAGSRGPKRVPAHREGAGTVPGLPRADAVGQRMDRAASAARGTAAQAVRSTDNTGSRLLTLRRAHRRP